MRTSPRLFSESPGTRTGSVHPLVDLERACGGRDALANRLPLHLFRELEDLRMESDIELLGEGLLQWAIRAERAGHGDVAVAAYGTLSADPNLSVGLRQRLGERREVLDGGGPLGARLEHQAAHLTQELLSPSSIFAMGAGGAVFRLTRWAVLGRLGMLPAGFWTRGPAASALASFSGFLLEAPAFTLSSQTLRGLGGQPWPTGGELGAELARSYLSLGGLRLGGTLARGLQRGLRQESNLLLSPLFRQSGMFGGIWASGLAEESWGLHPARSASDRLFDSLVLLLHFNIGGHLAQQAFGPNFHAWENSIDRQSLSLSQIRPAPARPRPAWISPWLAPMWMAMGAGGIGLPRGPQLSLNFSEPAPARAATSAPPFSAPDLAMAESLRRASPEAWTRGMESLRARGHLVSEQDQVSFIRHLRLKPGIARLGEIFRNQGPASSAAAAALRELATEDRPAVLREFQRALRESHTLGAVQALDALAQLGATELLPEIQALPQNHPSPIASAAEAARLRLNDSSLIPELQRRAQDRRLNDIDRISAWEGVGQGGNRDLAVENLRGFFRHFHSPQTQRRAALALTRLGASAAVLSLEHHLEHSPPLDRAEFCEAFFDRGSEAEALRLWRGLARGPSSESRRAALNLSGSHPRAEMIPDLQSLRTDAYPEIRMEAGRRLIELAASQGQIEILESSLESAEPTSLRESEALQVQAAAALLTRGGHPAARERLRTYLESSFGEIRLQAAGALWDHGDSSAVPALRQLSQGGEAELRHRAAVRLLGQRGIENTSLNGRLGASIGWMGLGALAWLLDPAIAEASIGASSSPNTWELPTTLLIGAVAVAAMRGGRGSEPPSPGEATPPETLGWFESAYDAAETYPLPQVGEAGAVIGRSTLRAPNVFGADLRHISRRHMDLRVQQDRIEVRLHDGARGLRINGQNLLPFQWHPLRDQDWVEFVGSGNGEARVLRPTEEGDLLPTVLRFGQRPVEARDAPAIFRFHRTPPAHPPATPVPPRPRYNLVERIGNFFGGSRPAPESGAADSRPTPPPIAAIRTNLHAEIAQLSQILSTPMALLEMALRSPDFHSPSSRADTLTALIRIHRQICGRNETVAWTEISEERRAEGATGWVRVPDWDGILSQRLEHFGRTLQQIEQERGVDAEIHATRLELGRIRDQLNRLYEMVRLFRRHFHEPEELVRLDAIEQAYRGLRPEVVLGGQRVRSMTRGLDATVRPSDRQAWIAEFESLGRPSRSMVNLRILMGEIQGVRGRPLAGSFYSALSSGTIYEGRRNVHFFFDTSSGQILGFDDGGPAAEIAMIKFRQDRLNVEEGILSVDPSGSGRIVDVTLLGPARDTVAEALRGLEGLRVLPPQIVHGWSGYEGDPDLQRYRLHLVPEFESPREEWYRVAGLIPQAETGQSILTIEPLSPSPERTGIQVLVPSQDILGVSVDDVLTVHPDSP